MKPPVLSPRVRTLLIFAAPVVVGAALFLAADGMRRGTVNDLTSLLLLLILASAWNLVGGFGGQFSLGHSIFVGVGGYTTALIMNYLQAPLLLTLVAAGAVSAAAGLILSYPLLRLRGPYLAIGSLGMALAAMGWMMNWDFTRASQAYPLPSKQAPGLVEIFQITTVVAVVAVLAVIALLRSPLGLRLIALRDDEKGAASLGVRRLRTLVPVWALSGFLTGLMGSLSALQKGSLTPATAFNVQFALDAAIVCVIGGLGTLSGPIVGAIVVFYLRYFSVDFADWSLLIEGVIVVLVVRFVPGGIVGLVKRGWIAVRTRYFGPPPSDVTGVISVQTGTVGVQR